jgi:hypothetical protein
MFRSSSSPLFVGGVPIFQAAAYLPWGYPGRTKILVGGNQYTLSGGRLLYP